MKKSILIRCALGAVICVLLMPTQGLGTEMEHTIERQVEPGGPGGNRLEVDVELLAGTANAFRDFRLWSQRGEEVPFLLLAQPTVERKWREGEILPLRTTRRGSGFEIDLGAITKIDRVKIEGLPTPFLKRLRIEAGGDRSRWTLLHEQATLFDLPDEGMKLLELDFEPGEYRYLRVVWSDGSSARVPLPRRVSARLLEGSPPAPPLEASLRFEERASEPGSSRYRILLPGEFMLNALRLVDGFSEAQFEARTGLAAARLGEAAGKALARGLIERSLDGRWRPTDLGRRFLNDLQGEFLRES